jgi:hypothetical protein
MPCRADLRAWITSSEQPEMLGPAAAAESFIGSGQQPPRPVERVVFAATMPEGLILDPASDPVETLVGEVDEMERISDLDRVGQDRVEHFAVRPDRSSVAHRSRSRHACGRAASHAAGADAVRSDDVEELTPSDIDDLRGPLLTPPGSEPEHECLIEADRFDIAEPVGSSINACP